MSPVPSVISVCILITTGERDIPTAIIAVIIPNCIEYLSEADGAV